MQYKFVPYLWISLALALMLISLIVLVFRRYNQKGVPHFLIVLLLSLLWITAQTMELAAVELPVKIAWANIVYIPSTFCPVAYFFLALQYLEHNKWLQKRWLAAMLTIMPVLYNVLVWTNDYHGLVRRNVYLAVSGSFSVVGKTYGSVFWIYTVYNFLLAVATLAILLRGCINSKNRLQRAQLRSLFLGLLLPMFSVFIYIFKVLPFKVDPTPIVIGVSSIIISWSIFRHHLFDLISIAHSMVIKEMSTGIIILDDEGTILEFNPAARKMLKIPPDMRRSEFIETLLSAHPRLLEIYGEKTDCVNEIFVRSRTGFDYCEVSFKKLTNRKGTAVGWIFQIYDVTKRKQEEILNKELAMHDSLTGLINRAFFEKMFLNSLNVSEKTGKSFAVAYLDLDDFKIINDTLGHNAGDVLLRKVAEALKTILKGTAIVSRYGGDEFAILFPSIENRALLDYFSEKISDEFDKCIEYNGLHIPIKTSIGFGVYPEDGCDMDMLLKKADGGMYEMKRSKKCMGSV